MDNENDQKWWLWIARYQDDERGSFLVYGVAAPILRKSKSSCENCETPLDGGGKFIVTQAVISQNNFRKLRDDLVGGLKPDILDIETRKVFEIRAVKTILQDSLGHGGVTVEIFFTTPDIEGILKDKVINLCGSMFKYLKDCLGFNFEKKYATRFGCFEIHNLHYWLETKTPFEISVVRAKAEIGEYLTNHIVNIKRIGAAANEHHFIHLICKDENDEVFNQMIRLPKGERHTKTIEIAEDFFDLEAWIFIDTGEIIHHESNSYIAGIDISTGVQGQEIYLNDKLTAKAKNINDEMSKKIASVAKTTYLPSTVNFGGNPIIRSHYAKMRRIAAECFPINEKDMWFDKSIENEVGVVTHFVDLIDNSGVKEAIIADPFFGQDSLVKLILRLKGSSGTVRVITSWASINPDTGNRYSQGDSPLDKLKEKLELVKKIINPNVQVINVVKNNEQAFHDRYLVLKYHKIPHEVYLLSNSLNNMSGKWPFCMSFVSPAVSGEIVAYLSRLISQSSTIAKGVTVNFDWRTGSR